MHHAATIAQTFRFGPCVIYVRGIQSVRFGVDLVFSSLLAMIMVLTYALLCSFNFLVYMTFQNFSAHLKLTHSIMFAFSP